MTNMPFDSLDQLRDIESLNRYRAAVAAGLDPAAAFDQLRWAGRDNSRTPFQWTAGRHAGFTSGQPWLEVNPNHSWLNAEAQYDAADSVFGFYRRLIALRHQDPVVSEG